MTINDIPEMMRRERKFKKNYNIKDYKWYLLSMNKKDEIEYQEVQIQHCHRVVINVIEGMAHNFQEEIMGKIQEQYL